MTAEVKAKDCISSKAKVQLANGTYVTLDSLKVGDKIKTLNGNGVLVDTDVIMFLHVAEEVRTFFKIETESNKAITISDEHLVAIRDGEFKFARELREGDSLISFDANTGAQKEERIKSIDSETVESYLAPLTMAGTLLADDLLVSCYASIKDHQMAHLAMEPIRFFYSTSNVLNMFMPAFVTNSLKSKKQASGIHWYPSLLSTFADGVFINNKKTVDSF
jgi:intein/homing endonuclease